MENLNDVAKKSLGDSTSYAIYTNKFDPSLLNPMPRALARQDWGIKGDEFVGYDVWHAHEATFLTDNGLPIAGTLKFVYDCRSEFMVESKSMKLYLNSFDMCKMGSTIKSASDNYTYQVKIDLETVLQTPVSVYFHPLGADRMGVNFLNRYQDMYPLINGLENEIFTDYTAEENHLRFEEELGHIQSTQVMTNILRSRCRHTKQKDTGTAFLRIDTKDGFFDMLSILKQIVSLREKNEFHEFCAEKLYVDFAPYASYIDGLMIGLLYARRGSLDINPIRASRRELLPLDIITSNIYTTKTQGQ